MRNKPRKKNPAAELLVESVDGNLTAEIRGLIEATRLRVAQTVNAELVLIKARFAWPST